MNYFQKIIVIVVIAIMFPSHIFAMSFFFESDHAVYGVEDSVIVDVYLDTDDVVVNTISGEIQIQSNMFKVENIIDGNSSILFWVDKPFFNKETGTIIFSGITPGGVGGENLFLFSIRGMITEVDEKISFGMNEGFILLHDGLGTTRPVSFITKSIFSSEDPTFKTIVPIPEDREAPEDFNPIITQDSNLYDGKYVLVFATQDKASGIDRYEIREGFFGRYGVAESPYVLKDQSSFKTLFVKAIDKAGNERVAIVHPQEKLFDENFILISSILVLALIISIVYYRRKYS